MPVPQPGVVSSLPALLAGKKVSRGDHDWVVLYAHPTYHRWTGDVTLVLTLRDAERHEITVTTGFPLETFDGEHFGDPAWILDEMRAQALDHGEYYQIA